MFLSQEKTTDKTNFHLKRKEIFIAKILLNRKVLRISLCMYVENIWIKLTNIQQHDIYNKLDKTCKKKE